MGGEFFILGLLNNWIVSVHSLPCQTTLPTTLRAKPFTWPSRRFTEPEGEHFETQCYLSVTYLPPPTARKRFEKYLLSGKDGSEVDWRRVLSQYERALIDLEKRLGGGTSPVCAVL